MSLSSQKIGKLSLLVLTVEPLHVEQWVEAVEQCSAFLPNGNPSIITNTAKTFDLIPGPPVPTYAKKACCVRAHLCSKEVASSFQFPIPIQHKDTALLGLRPTKLPVKWDIQPGPPDVPAFRDDTK